MKGADVIVAYEGSFAAGDTVAKVFYSNNSGQSWTNITQNLYSMVQFKFHSATSFTVHNGNLFVGGLSPSGLYKFVLTTTGLSDLKTANVLRLYPNPVTSTLLFDVPIQHVSIMDITGKLLLSTSVSNKQIDVSDLSKGFYFVVGMDGETTYQAKFIKE